MTDRKKDYEKAERALLDSLPEPICETDRDGHVTYANPVGLKTFGYTRKDMADFNVLSGIAPEYRDQAKANISRIMSGEEVGWTEHWALRKDGSTFFAAIHSKPIERDGEVVGMRSLVIDMTAHRQAEDRFRQLYEFAPTLYHTLDPQGRITDVNRKWCQTLGYAKEEVLGKPIFDFVLQEERAISMASFEKKKEKKNSGDSYVQGHERRYCAKDGRVLTFRINDFLSLTAEGDVQAVHTTMEDITEIEETEQELREANVLLSKTLTELRRTQKQVVEQERLSALGQMASGMAHDFNNALMPIVGFSEYLLTNRDVLEDEEEALSILQDIRTAAEDARQAVHRLRYFYRPLDEGQLVILDLNALMEKAIDLTQPRWKKEMGAQGAAISIVTDFGELPPIKGNESQLREAVTNSLLNAFDAMPDGGTLTVRTHTEGEWVIAEISDTGIGMPDDVKLKCFEPFFTTKGKRGTGMGLAVTYGTIRQHHGRLEVTSREGQGTTLTFHLPKQLVLAEPIEEEDVVVQPIRPLRILMADDELRSRESVTKFLKYDKHELDTATSGKEALEKFRKGSFDLVITDRAMTDMSGDKVAEEIEASGRKIPVIMLTGFGDLMKDTDQHPVGVSVILSKPVTQTELRQAIATATRGMPE